MMSYSMVDYLKVFESSLSSPLFTQEAISSVKALAEILPPSSLAGFECRLQADDPTVDFQTMLPSLDRQLPGQFVQSPIWQRLHNFYQDWTSSGTKLNQQLDSILLEFDVNSLPSLPLQIPSPCIFLKLQDKVDQQIFISLIEQLFDSQISTNLESRIELCFDSLPNGARISHLGGMLSRSHDTVRINVINIALEDIPEYLKCIGWVDLNNKLYTVIESLSGLVDYIMLSFDVGNTVSPRIGLECFINTPSYEDVRPWQLFLNYLVEQELCSAAKKEALLEWPKLSTTTIDSINWPSNISWGDRFLASRAFSVFWKRINHIKLIYQQGELSEAKGYLAFGHNWTDKKEFLEQTQSGSVDGKESFPYLSVTGQS